MIYPKLFKDMSQSRTRFFSLSAFHFMTEDSRLWLLRERESENLLKQCTPRQLLQKQQKVKSTAPQSPNVQQSCAIDLFGWCSIRNRTVDQNVVANSKAKVCQPLVWSRFHRLEKLFWPTPVSWRNWYTNNNVKKFKSKQQLHDSMYI